MKKRILLFILIVVCLFVATPLLRAQTYEDDSRSEDSGEDDDFPEDPGETDVPFDDGVYWLMAAGICYGIYSAVAKKRTETELSRIKEKV